MAESKLRYDNMQELILVNAVEELARQWVDESIEKMNMCNCEKCRLNACAIVLNALTPRYVTTTRGMLFTEIKRLSIEYRVALAEETTKALMIVKEHPMHD